MSHGPWTPTASKEEPHITYDRRNRISKATHNHATVEKVPPQAHFAVLVNEQYHSHDGYSEREGGGYRAFDALHYITFDDEEALEYWILENHTKKTFMVIHVKPVDVKLKTVINLAQP